MGWPECNKSLKTVLKCVSVRTLTWCCEHTAGPQADDGVVNRPLQWTSCLKPELGSSLVGATCRGYILAATLHDGRATADVHIDKNVATCRSCASHGRPSKLWLDCLGCFVFTEYTEHNECINPGFTDCVRGDERLGQLQKALFRFLLGPASASVSSLLFQPHSVLCLQSIQHVSEGLVNSSRRVW